MSFDAIEFLEGLYRNRGDSCPDSPPAEHSRCCDASEEAAVFHAESYGDELRLFCPTSETREAIEHHRERIELLLAELACDPSLGEEVLEEIVERIEPCHQCGSLAKWWDMFGGEHCQICERDKFERGLWLWERLVRLKERIEQTAAHSGSPEPATVEGSATGRSKRGSLSLHGLTGRATPPFQIDRHTSHCDRWMTV